MFKQDNIVRKVETEVKITLTDGTTLTGFFFIKKEQRLIDLLNDQRPFIPYKETDGMITLIRKSSIDRITPIDQTIPREKTIPEWFGNPLEGISPTN